jgi:adenylate cyclase
MCGGRARCSTCRVRVTNGEEFCPPPANDEQATLTRIGAAPDVRLACQLRPQGDIVGRRPLVRTARPIYRATAPRRNGEREVVVLFCDFRNRADLSSDHLPQDLLYVLTLYVEGVGNAIRASGGALSYVEFDSICALFGHEGDANAAQGHCGRGGDRGRHRRPQQPAWPGRDSKVRIAVSIHAGRAAIGEVGRRSRRC